MQSDIIMKKEIFMFHLTNNEMIISNTGPSFNFTEKSIFERFSKSENSEGIGLGFAIVKQICDNYAFVIDHIF